MRHDGSGKPWVLKQKLQKRYASVVHEIRRTLSYRTFAETEQNGIRGARLQGVVLGWLLMSSRPLLAQASPDANGSFE